MAKKLKDRYELIEELGKGGMGIVYRGRDTELDRDVAIKLLPPQLSQDPTFLQRFEREAKAVTSLEHNNIVPVYDFGQDRNQTFLVMRLLRGGDLKKLIQNHPLSLKDAIRILRQVGSALDRAHANNIIHRDLKPGNILFDDEGNAFLGDFGIVKLTNESASFTQTGGTLGTPYYMSPEQIRDPHNIDHRTDLYSLGVILYEMLTGNLPYESDSSFDLQHMHVNNPIPSILEANSDLPEKVEDVIQKAMSKKREDRYSSARELVNDLEIAATAPATTAAIPATMGPKKEPKPEPVIITPTEELDPEPEEIEPEPAVAIAATPVAAQGISSPVAAAIIPEPAPATSAPTPAAAAPKRAIPAWLIALIGAVGGIILLFIIVIIFVPDPETEPANAGSSESAFMAAVDENSEAIVAGETGALSFDPNTFTPYLLRLDEQNFRANAVFSDSDGDYVYGFIFLQTAADECRVYVDGQTAYLEYYDNTNDEFTGLGEYSLQNNRSLTAATSHEAELVVWGDVALLNLDGGAESVNIDISDCPESGNIAPYIDHPEGSGAATVSISVDRLPSGDPPVQP